MLVYNWFVSWLLAKRYEWVATEDRVDCGDGAYRRGPVVVEGRKRVPIDGLTNGRRERIARRVALTLTAAVALGWGVWYLVTGSVPAATTMSLPVAGAVSAPFALSHLLYAPLIGVWSYVLLSKTGLRFRWKQLAIALPVLAISLFLTWFLFLPTVVWIFLAVVGALSGFNLAVCRTCEENRCPIPSTGRVLRYSVIGALMLLPGIGPAVMLPVGLGVAGYRLVKSTPKKERNYYDGAAVGG